MPVALKCNVMPWEVTVFKETLLLAEGFLYVVGRQRFYRGGGGGGGTPRKIGWGCAALFPNPLPYL